MTKLTPAQARRLKQQADAETIRRLKAQQERRAREFMPAGGLGVMKPLIKKGRFKL